jgi:hypothetical protein
VQKLLKTAIYRKISSGKRGIASGKSLFGAHFLVENGAVV